jgi:Domain of Unknown Function (DUF928)
MNLFKFNSNCLSKAMSLVMLSGLLLESIDFSLIPRAVAQPSSTSKSALRFQPTKLSAQQQLKLAKRGAPRRRGGAGTRGDCPDLGSKPQAVALVSLIQPAEKTDSPIALGLTTEARPMFWFYIPYDRSKLSTVRFTLLDESENPVVEPIALPLGTVPGIVGFRLPESAPPLAVGQYYHWYLLMDCLPKGTTDVFVEALVQRVELPTLLKQQLMQATPRDRARLYAANGIWHDALTELQLLRQSSPKNASLAQDWRDLLESQGLTQVVDK